MGGRLYDWVVATSVTETLLTADEFYRLSDPPHGGKMELVYGRVVIHIAPAGKHGERSLRIGRALQALADRTGIACVTGETGYLLQTGPDLVRGPDVALVLRSRLPGGDLAEEGYVPVPPDLAVEVVSPNDLQRDVLEKVGEYVDAGVPRVWVVYARTRSVVVYGPEQEQRILLEGETLGPAELGIEGVDFALPVSDIFR